MPHALSDPQDQLEERLAHLNDVVIPAYEAETARWAELPEHRRAQINEWRLKIDATEAILCHDLAAQEFRRGDPDKLGDKYCAMALAAKSRVRLHTRMVAACRVSGKALVPL